LFVEFDIAVTASSSSTVLGFQDDGPDDGLSALIDTVSLTKINNNLDVGASDGFTIDAWINPDTTTPQPIVEWNNGATFGVHFWHSFPGAGDLFANVVDNLGLGAGSWHTFDSADFVVSSKGFQHVALTYDKTTGNAVLYRNGIAVANSNLGIFTPQTSYDLYFGSRTSGGEKYDGLIDEVEIHNRVLSQA